MVKQATLKPALRVGGAGVSKTAEDFMGTYAYQILTDKATLEVMAKLPISEDGLVAAIVTMEELEAAGYKGKTVGSALQRFNSVFACGTRIPYKAMSANSKRVDDIETVHKEVLKIYRTGAKFNPDLYSTTEAGHISKKDNEVIAHEDAPDGLVEAIHNWIREDAQEWDVNFLKALGLDKTINALAEEEPEE